MRLTRVDMVGHVLVGVDVTDVTRRNDALLVVRHGDKLHFQCILMQYTIEDVMQWTRY